MTEIALQAMRRFLAAAAFIGASLLATAPARADLGAADTAIGGSNRIYDALCGKNEKDCRVAFKNDRLIVDNGDGIGLSQLIGLTYEKIHTGDWLSTWHFHEYRVRYRAENGATSVGIIRFKNDGTSDDFKRDFQDWTGEPLRIVGPSVKLTQ